MRFILWLMPRQFKSWLKAKIVKALTEAQMPHYYTQPQTREEIATERKILGKSTTTRN